MSEVAIEIHGPQAESLAAELEALLQEELGETGRRVQAPMAAAGTKADPVAVAALVISLPSAILATMDLAKRLDLVPRVQRLLAWARGKAGSGTELTLITSRKSLRLAEASADEVMDACAEADRITKPAAEPAERA